MNPIDFVTIEREARQLRAQELRRIEELVAERMSLYGRLLIASARSGLVALGDILRPLFSWNPQARRSH